MKSDRSSFRHSNFHHARLFLATVILFLLFYTFATAASGGTLGSNIHWTLNDSGVLTISGTGSFGDYWTAGSSAPWKAYRAMIHKVIIEDGIQNIGNYSFSLCENLTDITIPNSVTSIGNGAFQYCHHLSSVILPNGLTKIESDTFYFCERLANVVIPESVTQIQERAFANCNSLTSVSIPKGVSSILSSAFSGCSSLSSIYIATSVNTILTGAFSQCPNLTIVSTYCDDYARTWAQQNHIPDLFLDHHNVITDEMVPPTCTDAGLTEGSHCEACAAVLVSQVGIPALGGDHIIIHDPAVPATCTEPGLTDGDHCSVCGAALHPQEIIPAIGHTIVIDPAIPVTENEPGLTQGSHCSVCGEIIVEQEYLGASYYTFENGILTIGGYGRLGQSFSNNGQIEEVIIQNGITSIPSHAFDNCWNLKTVKIPGSVKAINQWSFSFCDNLCDVTLENGISRIEERAFSRCLNLQTIRLPDSVNFIGDDAFSFCEALTTVELSPNITHIGKNAFYSCSKLDNIALPKALKTIGEWAFGYCKKISEITIPGGVTTIEPETFFGCTSLRRVYICEGVQVIERAAFSMNSLQYMFLPKSLQRAADLAIDLSARSQLMMYVYEDTKAHLYAQTHNFNYQIIEKLTPPQYNAYSFYLPASLTAIDDEAFMGDTFDSMYISSNCTTIGQRAFANCSNLEYLYIPASVTYIQANAFSNCRKIILIGPKNSYAEQLAKEIGVLFIPENVETGS